MWLAVRALSFVAAIVVEDGLIYLLTTDHLTINDKPITTIITFTALDYTTTTGGDTRFEIDLGMRFTYVCWANTGTQLMCGKWQGGA